METNLSTLIKNGNIHAYEVFYMAEYNNIVFFINSYMRDMAESEDIAQEAFTSLWVNRVNIDISKNIRSFVYTIAKNKALDKLKQKKRRGNENNNSLDISINALSDDIVDAKIHALELGQLIKETLDTLPKNVIDFFILNRKYGLTYCDIAKQKGTSVKVVEYRIKIALKIFKNNLRDYIAIILLIINLINK